MQNTINIKDFDNAFRILLFSTIFFAVCSVMGLAHSQSIGGYQITSSIFSTGFDYATAFTANGWQLVGGCALDNIYTPIQDSLGEYAFGYNETTSCGSGNTRTIRRDLPVNTSIGTLISKFLIDVENNTPSSNTAFFHAVLETRASNKYIILYHEIDDAGTGVTRVGCGSQANCQTCMIYNFSNPHVYEVVMEIDLDDNRYSVYINGSSYDCYNKNLGDMQQVGAVSMGETVSVSNYLQTYIDDYEIGIGYASEGLSYDDCPYSSYNQGGWYENFEYYDSILNHEWTGLNLSPELYNNEIVLRLNAPDSGYLKKEENIQCGYPDQDYSFYIRPYFNGSDDTHLTFSLEGNLGVFATFKLIKNDSDSGYLQATHNNDFYDVVYTSYDPYLISGDTWHVIRVHVDFDSGYHSTYTIYIDGVKMRRGTGLLPASWNAKYYASTYTYIDTLAFYPNANAQHIYIDNINRLLSNFTNYTINYYPDIEDILIEGAAYESGEWRANESVPVVFTVYAEDAENDTLYYSVNCDYGGSGTWSAWDTDNETTCTWYDSYEDYTVRVAVTDDYHLGNGEHDIYEEYNFYVQPFYNYQNFSDIDYTCTAVNEGFDYTDAISNHGWAGNTDFAPVSYALSWENADDAEPYIFYDYHCEIERYDVSFDLNLIDIEGYANDTEFAFKVELRNTEDTGDTELLFEEREGFHYGALFFYDGAEYNYIGTFDEGTCYNYLISYNFRQKTASIYQNDLFMGRYSLELDYNSFQHIKFKHVDPDAGAYIDNVRIGLNRSLVGCYASETLAEAEEFEETETDYEANAITSGVRTFGEPAGLSEKIIWLIVMIVVAYGILTSGSKILQSPSAILAAIIIVEIGLTILGVYLGFFSAGLIIMLAIIGMIVIGLWLRAKFTGTAG